MSNDPITLSTLSKTYNTDGNDFQSRVSRYFDNLDGDLSGTLSDAQFKQMKSILKSADKPGFLKKGDGVVTTVELAAYAAKKMDTADKNVAFDLTMAERAKADKGNYKHTPLSPQFYLDHAEKHESKYDFYEGLARIAK